MPDSYSNMLLVSSDASLSLLMVDISYRQTGNSTKLESATMTLLLRMNIFGSTKISPDMSLIHPGRVGVPSHQLSSSQTSTTMNFDGTGLAPFLTRLRTGRAGDWEFERGGVLGLRFRGRLNFRRVNFVMFWGRKRETVKGECVLDEIDDLVKKVVMRQQFCP